MLSRRQTGEEGGRSTHGMVETGFAYAFPVDACNTGYPGLNVKLCTNKTSTTDILWQNLAKTSFMYFELWVSPAVWKCLCCWLRTGQFSLSFARSPPVFPEVLPVHCSSTEKKKVVVHWKIVHLQNITLLGIISHIAKKVHVCWRFSSPLSLNKVIIYRDFCCSSILVETQFYGIYRKDLKRHTVNPSKLRPPKLAVGHTVLRKGSKGRVLVYFWT